MFKLFNKKNNNISKKISRISKSRTSGFTLIELMVSVSIFTVIMVLAMGSLLITLDAKKKSEALSFTMDNLNFAMESMTRSLRMGNNYFCNTVIVLEDDDTSTKDCDNGKQIAFTSSDAFGSNNASTRMAYDIKNNTIERCFASLGCMQMISSNISIDENNSGFYVIGSESNDGQPSVYIKLSGSMMVKNDEIPFSIQTIVSQRKLDSKL